MSGVCEVLSCKSNYEPGRTYHRFPIDLARRREWSKILGIKPKNLKTASSVCSRHFRDKDYEYNKRLFSYAVPCLRLNQVKKKVESPRTLSQARHRKQQANIVSKVKKGNSKSPTKIKKYSKNGKLRSLKTLAKQNCTDRELRKEDLQTEASRSIMSSTPKEDMHSKSMENSLHPKLSTRRSLQTDAKINQFQGGVKRKNASSNKLSPIVKSHFSKKCSCCTENMVKTTQNVKSLRRNKIPIQKTTTSPCETARKSLSTNQKCHSESTIKSQKRSLELSGPGSIVKKRKITKENHLPPNGCTKVTPQSKDCSSASSSINSKENLNNSKFNCNLTHIEKTIMEMKNKINKLEQKSILDEEKIETFKNALIEQRRNDIRTLMDEKESELLLRMDLLYLNYDPTRICRLCLVLVDKKEILTSLVSHPKNQALISLIRNATNIQIELEDGLPSGICSECLHQIKRIDWIQRKTHKSNTLIKKFVMMRKNFGDGSTSSTNTMGPEKLLISDNPSEEEEGTDVFKIEDVFSLESSCETIPFDETIVKLEAESDEETEEVYSSQDLYSVNSIVPDRRMWTCRQCQTVFTNRWTRINHTKFCNQRFQCSECNKQFWNARLLRNHKVRRQSCVSSENQRVCFDCQIAFRWKWKLVFHVLQHRV
uniref:Uncharacterized protein n=1 Tax=Graphocephala atropunctata TaxID=36148 RepID=A0A1B6M0D6_9HEMI